MTTSFEAAPSVRPLSIGPGAPVMALDIGGTDIKASRVDETGLLSDVTRIPTPAMPTELVKAVRALRDDLYPDYPGEKPDALGVSLPGHVDESAGIAVSSANLGWNDLPLARLLSDELDVPVGLVHDLAAAGMAEQAVGAAGTYDRAAVLGIGTGISAALILDGNLYRAGGYAGEVGHLRIADEPRCSCGGFGCAEAIGSARAIARRYSQATRRPITSAEEVIDLAASGDRTAQRVWDEALDAITATITALVSVMAPDAIVIAGGLSNAGEALLQPLQERLAERIIVHRRPALVVSPLRGEAGVIGAALRARDVLA